MIKILLIVALIFLINVINFSYQIQVSEIFDTDKGKVRGVIYHTLINNLSFSGFKGIPYAKPPVGSRRFQAPEENDPWEGVLKLTGESKSSCPQWNLDTNTYGGGSEDCLYLNVYTPKIKGDDTRLRPVMVWIYGGAFTEGYVNASLYGPDYLLEEDIVLVAMNYRLGALGFLSLEIPEASGNAGLKDQNLALKWVNRNIQNFGGDPKLITLFGQSAGSVAVQLHKLSPMSRGLFTRSIAMSGSPLNIWAVIRGDQAVARAYYLAAELGITVDDRHELLQELLKVPAKKIIKATHKMVALIIPFKPTIEVPDKSVNPFLTECPLTLYENGNFSQEPHMLGFVHSEFISFLDSVASFMRYVNYTMSTTLDITGIDTIADITRLRGVLNTSVNSLNDLGYDIVDLGVKVTTDLFFIVGIDRTQSLLSKGSGPVYYYRNSFDYPMATHKLRGNQLNGTAHSDDIAHIFHIRDRNDTFDPNLGIALQRRRMVKMWTNMARFGNPTPRGTDDPVLNIVWPDTGKNGTCLEINYTYEVGPRPIDDLIGLLRLLPSGPVRYFAGTCPLSL